MITVGQTLTAGEHIYAGDRVILYEGALARAVPEEMTIGFAYQDVRQGERLQLGADGFWRKSVTDADFERGLNHYYDQMGRFIEAHRRNAAPAQAEMLIELKRPEQWRKSMGVFADVASPPDLPEIEAAARKLGWAI